MKRTEAVVLLAVALTLLVAGFTWMFGAPGLLLSGAALAALTLFVFDIREESRGEPVVNPARPAVRR